MEKVKWWTKTPTKCEVYERNQRLEFEVGITDEGVHFACVGVVSRDRYDLTKGKVSIYITNTGEIAQECALLISPHKTTTDFPRNLPDYYAILLLAMPNFYATHIYRRVGGGDFERIYAGSYVASGSLKMEIEAGFIRFYLGDTLLTYDAYRLPNYECYIYIYRYASGCCIDPSWADDFYCEYVGTVEEKVEAQTRIYQQRISEWMKANWIPLSVICIVLAIVFAIIMGLI